MVSVLTGIEFKAIQQKSGSRFPVFKIQVSGIFSGKCNVCLVLGLVFFDFFF